MSPRCTIQSPLALAIALVCTLVSACGGNGKADEAQKPDSVARLDTQAVSLPPREPPRPVLSPVADTIAQWLVFAPRGQQWFTAAARGKRLLVDIGRIDIEVRKDSARAAGYLEAVRRLSPIKVGARFRIAGPWGADSAVLSSFASWNGRIVGVLDVTGRADSLVRTVEPLPASALLTDSVVAPAVDSCQRDSVAEEVLDRAGIVRDSISQHLLDSAMPPFERLRNSVRMASSRVIGCYGTMGRVMVIVSLRAGNNEFVAERFAVVDDTGYVTPLRANDFRFPAHDGVYALDADRDGVDDLATRAMAEGMGALSILRTDTSRKRLDRLTSGFAWEAR